MTKNNTLTNIATRSSKVLAYARVSSKEQDTEGYSIAAQQKILREYATRHAFIIEKEFVDVETAKATGRTSFTEMLNYLKKHPASASFLSRRQTDSIAT